MSHKSARVTLLFLLTACSGTQDSKKAAAIESKSRPAAAKEVSPAGAANRFPDDVSRFIKRREECDHWRGEEAYDDERQAEILTGQNRTCSGTDAELAALKAKYPKDASIQARLDAFDSAIE